jgi:hypothetical protein
MISLPHVLAGTVAGASEAFFVHPLDTYKVRTHVAATLHHTHSLHPSCPSLQAHYLGGEQMCCGRNSGWNSARWRCYFAFP